jgi:hypothetical protein
MGSDAWARSDEGLLPLSLPILVYMENPLLEEPIVVANVGAPSCAQAAISAEARDLVSIAWTVKSLSADLNTNVLKNSYNRMYL